MHETENALILIVDDNPQNLQMLANMLRERGYKSALARTGVEALDYVQKRSPDCILLDILMPGLDGFETCQRLKADPRTRDIPVLFLTSVTEMQEKLRAFAAGGVDYITKPFQAEEVAARVATHLHLRRMHAQLQAQNAQLHAEIAERKRAEADLWTAHRDLQEANQELQQVNATKDKFFSIISHDLRSPFSALLGFSEWLKNHLAEYDQEEIQAQLEHIHTSAKQLYTLLENLLTWSRLQRGIIQYEPEYIDFKQLIEINVDMLRTKAAQKQIELTHAIREKILVFADYQMVNTILRNLLSNALKFTPSGGAVQIHAVTRGAMLEVAVSDTGVGIPPQDVSKLFQVDLKYTKKGTDGETGTGLGLSLCQEMIAHNGGRIEVFSEVGKGTTFTFTLPIQPAKKAKQPLEDEI